MEYQFNGKTIKVNKYKFNKFNYIAVISVDDERVWSTSQKSAEDCEKAIMQWIDKFECTGAIK